MGADPRYLALYRTACETYDARVRRGPPPATAKLIAYFLRRVRSDGVPAGLLGWSGILSGDHLKSSSDQDYPLIGLGLLYQQGFFRQFLNPTDGSRNAIP